jgi:hypothetical protein
MKTDRHSSIMDESYSSFINNDIYDMDLDASMSSAKKKMPTMTFIPNVEKSIDML